MTAWNTFSPEQKMAAERVFDGLSNVDTMTNSHQGGKRLFGFQDLYSFVTGLDSTLDAELKRALEGDHRLRENLDGLLAETALYQAEQVAAASSGAVDMRCGEGFKIQLRESRVAPQQIYIIIELKKPTATPPTTLILSGPRAVCHKRKLPEPQDGIIQILEDNDSDMVATLRDIHTQVFLR